MNAKKLTENVQITYLNSVVMPDEEEESSEGDDEGDEDEDEGGEESNEDA